MSDPVVRHHISLLNLFPHTPPAWQKALVALADRLLGIRKMDSLYHQHQMQGLSKEVFAQKLLTLLKLNIQGLDALQAAIPKTGPVVIASNHPFGGIEGVFLSLAIGEVRPDLKVLANQGLQLFPELTDYFIFTNPLSEGDVKNAPSLRASLKHVKQGNALLIFPAGRVSYYRKDKKRVSEHSWNRIIAKLINSAQADYVPVFVSGQNSQWFYNLGRIHERLRMLRLAHELLNKTGQQVQVSCGQPIAANAFNPALDLDQQAALCRALSYAQDPDGHAHWPAAADTPMAALATPLTGEILAKEIAALPPQQQLYTHKNYTAYYGWQAQLPNVVKDIARLREQIFRQHNEGSGQPLDTDAFDATYTQLFIFDHQQQQIVGAYRMGQSDKLLAAGGLEQLYLSRMFDFKAGFVNRQQPCLEMGRSFVIPALQRSYLGLYLLWRGIGSFLRKHPQYRTLYGTVSISKLYQPASVALVQHLLTRPSDQVSARTPFTHQLHPELKELACEQDLTLSLDTLLNGLEQDHKGLPVLIRQYQKMGARFYTVGIDSNFNHTPGLLLSVDVTKTPEKLLKLYMGEGWQAYRDWQQEG